MHRHPFPIAALLAAMLLPAACGPSADREPATREASVPTPLRAEVAIEPTARSTSTALPTSAMRGDGGSGDSGSGEGDLDWLLSPPTSDPSGMAPDTIARIDQFNGSSGAGDGEVGDMNISVRLAPEGCAPPDGGPAHGTFVVGVSLLGAPGQMGCGALGETVIVNGAAIVFGTAGDDILDAARIPAGLPALVFGFEGDDLITIPDGAMVVAYGGAGDDTMSGGHAGNDLMGGPGDDHLTGGDGPDFIAGGDGDDLLVAGAGEDELYGEDGADTLDACADDPSPDHLLGGAGLDAFAVTFLADIVVDDVGDALDAEPVTQCDAMAPRP